MVPRQALASSEVTGRFMHFRSMLKLKGNCVPVIFKEQENRRSDTGMTSVFVWCLWCCSTCLRPLTLQL